MFSVQEYDWIDIPSGKVLTNQITIQYGMMLSVGWANDGFKNGLYASQLFVEADGQSAFLQIVNTSKQTLRVKPSAVCYTDSAAAQSQPAKAVFTAELTEAQD